MKYLRLTLVLAVAGALTAAPVITPVWAASKPVSPKVHTEPLAGVDQNALEGAPAAFDPTQLDAVGTGTATARVAKSKRPAAFSAPISPGKFTAAGVSWASGNASAKVAVQARVLDNGTWSDWEALDASHGPDADSPEGKRVANRISTEPIIAGQGQQVQVRVDTDNGQPPPELKLVTVDPGASAADANLRGAPASTAHSATVAPAIITRAQWGADESMRNCTATYSPTIKVGFVHHTTGTNSYGPGDSAGIVRGIYAYHVNGNGWCDIGYNFLVDRFGQIFEGRAGGMDKPVIGAHTLAFNYNSFAVSAMGTFSTADTPGAMLNSIGQVLGWKLGLHGRNPNGTDVLRSAGGDGARWPAGTMVTFNVVSGHRDAYSTDCPGAVLYGQLPTLRSVATDYKNSNTRPNDNLYGALTTQTGSGKVEVHAQSSSSNYGTRILDVATPWNVVNPSDWRFFFGSTIGDTRPDLIGVQAGGTPSGKVEIHVASWASNYQDTTVNTITPMSSFTPDTNWQISVGGPSGGDVYFIGLGATGSGTIEVHSLTADSGYTQWYMHSASALPTGYPSATSRFLVARGSGDLYAILHGTTGSGRSEVHALSASSRYQSFVMHAATPVGPTTDSKVSWLLGPGSVPDVNFVPLTNTGSNTVEVHRLSASSYYSSWAVHAATNLPPVSFPIWQFGLG